MSRYIILLFIAFLLSVSAVQGQINSYDYEGEINLFLSNGVQLPLFGSTYPGRGSELIPYGPVTSRLIDTLFITADVNDRFFITLDYDSSRLDFLGGGNIYQLIYLGKEYESLQKLTVGNQPIDFINTKFVSIPPLSDSGLGLSAQFKKDDFLINGLVQYDITSVRTKTFIGHNELIEFMFDDIDFVKGQYYFLPDNSIDTASLVVIREKSTVSGNETVTLIPGIDYTFDNQQGWIYLTSPLLQTSSLYVYYEKNTVSIGDISLGINAYITTAGDRVDFYAGSFPEYFSLQSGKDFLVLQDQEKISFWELRNAYYLSGIGSDDFLIFNDIKLVDKTTNAENTAYESILGSAVFDNARNVLFFYAQDEVGFQPRPFPGLEPFVNSTQGDNPFDPSNQVYQLSPGTALQKLQIQVSASRVDFFLDYSILENSVEVFVDNKVLAQSDYTVDYSYGTVRLKDDVYSPSSLIQIRWREGGLTGVDDKLVVALGIEYNKDITLGLLGALDIPLALNPSIENVSDARGIISGYTVYDTDLGPFDFSGSFEAAVSSRIPGIGDNLLIYDMQGEETLNLSVNSDSWLIGSRSMILNDADPTQRFNDRGELKYISYFEELAFRGTVLHDSTWNVPLDQVYDYSQRGGVYNTSDSFDQGSSRSVVFNYSFSAGEDAPFVNAVLSTSKNLAFADQLAVVYKTRDINGALPEIFIEVLEVYQEDINGNDLIDKESSSDEGFVITPSGGTQTVLGLNNPGNDQLDSEDINENGILDPSGLFATDSETGIILKQSGDPSSFTLQAAPEWTEVIIPLSDLVQSNPEIFQYAEAVRITIGYPDELLPDNRSGEILVNSIQFDGFPVKNVNPPPDTDIQFISSGSLTYSSAEDVFPEDYKNVLNTESYDPTILQWKFLTGLGAQEERSLVIIPESSHDLSEFEGLLLYLLLPQDQAIPPSTAISLDLELRSGSTVTIQLPLEHLRTGWNRLFFPLTESINARPIEGTVNNTPVNSKITGVLDAEVAQYTISIIAGDDVLAPGTYIYLSDLKTGSFFFSPELEMAASLSFRSNKQIGSLGSLPLFSMLELTLDSQGLVDLQQNEITDFLVQGDITANVLGFLPVSLGTGYNFIKTLTGNEQKDITSVSGSIGLFFTEYEYIPQLSIDYYAYRNDSRQSDDDLFLGSLSMQITEKIPENGLFKYQYIQKTELSTLSLFNESHDGVLSFPLEPVDINISGNYARTYKDINIVPGSVYNHLTDYFSDSVTTLKKQVPDDQNISDTFSVLIKPHSLVQIELNQNLFYLQNGYSSSFLHQQLNQDYKVSVPLQIGSVRIIPSIQRSEQMKVGTQQPLLALLNHQLQDLVFPLLAADISQWMREPLLTLTGQNPESDIQTANLSETLSLNTTIQDPPVWIPNTINISAARKGSVSGIINSSEFGIYTSIGKNLAGGNGTDFLWSLNSRLSFDTVYNWYYKNRTISSSLYLFSMFNFSEFSITSDINGTFKDISANENKAIQESPVDLPFKTSSLLVSGSVALNRPIKYTELLMDLFTHANHKDSLRMEYNGFIDEKTPSFGTSRIMFRTTYEHKSSFYIDKDAAMHFFITLQSGREQFWLFDGFENRDSLGIEMGISATLYL